MKVFLPALALLLLAGCTTHGRIGAPLTTLQSDAAEIVVIREWRFIGGGANLTVSLDGAPRFGIATSEHVVIATAPGYHVIGIVPKGPGLNVATVAVQAVARQRYYFRIETTAALAPGFMLQPISAESGEALMTKTTLIQ